MIVELVFTVAAHRPAHHHASRSEDRAPLRRWGRVAECESSGDWHANTGNGYYGGLQFDQSTWNDHGGQRFAARADLASVVQQIAVAEQLYDTRGTAPWPVCGQYLRAAA